MITLLGATGFVGSEIQQTLESRKIPSYIPARNEKIIGKELGDIIYCIGLTSDFRSRPHDTVTAHVSYLNDLIRENEFNSLTYLSSTRVYIHNESTLEDSPISIDPKDPFDLFNSSKLTGELLALNSGRKNIKIARLSNVYGPDFASDNFLTSILRDAIVKKKIQFRTTPDSSKDYISITDVIEMLIHLAHLNKTGIYNVAFGSNLTNEEISSKIATLTGCSVETDQDANKIVFPEISISKIIKDIGYKPKKNLVNELESLIANFKVFFGNENKSEEK
ncbi:NAD-dependent epimerase/dehydratase family protein [Leptospira vanthielii]|uniref:SDR family oxidoreductase n=1 Tax=Leptospira vanthielii TaxID=293085 RepID=A0ABY2NST5_9LEPT|nr:SDR family oxidoreductase [Leptospira vanthielii]TGM60666.1 SDR family oxidoreductase [Leptospira vanthielii]